MRRKEYVPPGRLAEWAARPDAALYLTRPGRGIFDDTELIRFGMAVHAHQRATQPARGGAEGEGK